MNIVKKWLYGNNKNIGLKIVFWNSCSSIEYSLQSAILILIITRINDLYDAGVFSIAYTFTQMMSTIGSYGMRSFQVSDVKNEFGFNTYYTSRIISVAAMIITCISYAFISGFNYDKMVIIIVLCGYWAIDNIEDVVHGEIQKLGRLDIASKIVAVRILISTIMFFITYLLTNDLLIASIALTVSSILIALFLNKIIIIDLKSIVMSFNKKNVFKLLWVCFPICIGGFFYTYLVNAPKYSIDRNLSEETQTIFSILFIPIFVINLLSSFIFKPMIVKMGIVWNKKDKSAFMKIVAKQMMIIIALTLIIMLGGAVIGLDILSLMYKVELGQYRLLFTIMLLFGGIAALVAFLVVVITIIRKQKFIIIAYSIGVLIDLIFVDYVVIKYGIWGAGIIYGISMGAIMITLLLVLGCTFFRKEENHNDRIAEKNIS